MVSRGKGREGVSSRGAGDMESKRDAIKEEKGSGETYNSMAVSNEKDSSEGDDPEQPSDYVEYKGLMTRQKALFSKSLLYAISLQIMRGLQIRVMGRLYR